MYKKTGFSFFILTFHFCLFSAIGKAQDPKTVSAHNVKGILKDSTSGEPIVSASLILSRVSDSTVARSVLSNKKGEFEFRNIRNGEYILFISDISYGNQKLNLSVSANIKDVDLGIITISAEYKLMEGVVVTVAPITFNGDTVEYRAGSFQTRPNATVEDLLQKLPGVEVDGDGNVTANGQTINRIYVDGKRFFGNEPKIATRNLSADMVDKIQLFEKLSEQAEFTGVDDGSGEMVLNIRIKANRRKGSFGRATVGYGTTDRYEASGIFNIFNNAKQISIISSANNINRQSFSEQDFSSSGGGGRGRGGMRGMGNMGGRGNSPSRGGITINKSIGFNYNDDWSAKLKVSGSYFYNAANRTNSTISNKQLFTSDSLVLTDAEQYNGSITGNHKFDMNLEYTLNPRTRITLRPNFSYGENETISNSQSISTSSNQHFLNAVTNRNNFATYQSNSGGTLNFMQRFDKRNRSLSISLDANHSLSKGNGLNSGVITKAFSSGVRIDSLDQQILQDNENIRYGTRLSYSEPLDSNRHIEFNVGLNNSISKTSRMAYAYNPFTNRFDQLVTGQSNDVISDFNRQSAGFNIRTRFEKYDYTIGLNVQHSELKSINAIKETNIYQQQWNFFPTAGFNYAFDQTKRLRINYTGSSNQPTASQLQDVRDSTNLLNIRVGNPHLKPEFNHIVNFNYNVFNRLNSRSMFATVRVGTSQHKIINSSSIKNGVSEIMPVNSNGFYNLNGNISFGFPIKPKVLTLNLSTNSGYSYATSFQNGQKNISRSLSAGETVTLNLNLKDKLDLSANGNISMIKTTYSIDPNRNNNFYRYSASVDASYSLPHDVQVQSEFNYNAIKGNTAGFNKPFTMMNASIVKQFLKNNVATIKITAFDILRQNLSVNRNVTEFAIEDIRSDVLTQYFMVSFTYNFRRFGGGSHMQRGDGRRQAGARS
jgi:hypothetical protein